VIVPTKRLVSLGFIAAMLATVAGYVPDMARGVFALDGVIILLAALDALLVRKRRMEATRNAPQIFSLGRANVVTVDVHNASARKVRGTLTDDPTEHAEAKGLPFELSLGPHESRTLKYEIVPSRRGARTFGAVSVRYRSPLGLIDRQERIEIEGTFDVYPDVHAARALEMLRRQGRQDAKMGSLRVRGGDTEFERLRPYQRGDEARHVDWRATARRDDMTVRQFQAESDQNVVFAIDTGRGMRGESAGVTHIDRALNAALLAADVALRGGDKAGMLAFDDTPRTFLRPTNGASAGRKIARAAHALEAGLGASDYRAAMTFLKTELRTRSLLVVFTNLLEPRSAKELAAAMKMLMPRHLPLCILMQDTELEHLAVSDVSNERDLYIRAAAAESLSFRDTFLRQLRNSGVLVLDAKPEDITPSLVNRYLEVKARRLL
jgi:uncharacterized protein (DUF58 family)